VTGRFHRGLIAVERGVAVVLLVATFTVILLQVFTRYVLGDPLSWTEELARFLLVWLAFVAAGYCTAERLHISVDLLLARLGRRAGAVVDTFANVAVVVAAGALAVAGAAFAADSTGLRAPATGLPMAVVYGAGALGFALVVLHGAGNAVHNLRRPEDVPGAMESAEREGA